MLSAASPKVVRKSVFRHGRARIKAPRWPISAAPDHCEFAIVVYIAGWTLRLARSPEAREENDCGKARRRLPLH